MSPVNSGVTGPNFTTFSHNMQAWFVLLMRTLRSWYPVLFLNARAIKVGSLQFRSSRFWDTCLDIYYRTTIYYVNTQCKFHFFNFFLFNNWTKQSNTISKNHNKQVTRNAWQSLAYSPLGAIVSPPNLLSFISRVQPCRTSISDQVSICTFARW